MRTIESHTASVRDLGLPLMKRMHASCFHLQLSFAITATGTHLSPDCSFGRHVCVAAVTTGTQRPAA
ncbi:hypothetical protein P7K49_029905 [Saguinus oedipus]|uniref:Uncharacterized protein n=1 Tax=Saguinus oedipus TaxID=9490 RepID=A0ABQ9U8M8_SAGOE|nr:hypothetical protein P7K49_029905 [Saguinus oedipus]